ncbi:MAG TPA: FAD-dependent oxidoreductase, partial [Mycobacterium sp.]|nr:FAD-dependent oxidoreductase [Mycobacterium sp.]
MDAQLACTEFAGALAGLPCAGATFRLAAHARRLTAGVTLSVSGRPGVGVSTVVRALTLAGFVVPGDDGDPGDVRLRVIAEVAKPEDHAALRAAEGPALVVFAKADLCGFDGDGPLANARLRCAELGARTGVSTRPLIGPLAVAGLDPAVLDDAMLAGLRTLVSVPADLSSVDAFVSGIYAGDARRLDVESAFPQLVEAEREYGSVVKGLARKKRQSGDGPLRIRSFARGMQSLTDRLHERLGARVHLRRAVESLQKR